MTIKLNKMIYTTSELAEMLGLPESAIRRLTKEGALRRMSGFEKPYKFSREQIKSYLREGGAE